MFIILNENSEEGAYIYNILSYLVHVKNWISSRIIHHYETLKHILNVCIYVRIMYKTMLEIIWKTTY